MNEGQPWIGLIEFRPVSSNPEQSWGAFCTVLVWSANEVEFGAKILRYLAAKGLTLVSIEDAEPLAVRLVNYEISDDLLEAASTLSQSNPVKLGTIHRFDER